MAVTKDAGFPVTARNTSGSAVPGYTWPSFTTPGTNRFIVAMFLGNAPAATALASFTSANLTWAQRLAVVTANNNWRVEIWTAFATSVVTTEVLSSAFVGAVNVAYNRYSLLIWSFDGSDATGNGNTASSITMTGDPSIAVTATAAGSYIVAGFPYRSAGADTAVDGNTADEYSAGGGGGFGFNERAGSRTSSGAGSLTLGWTGDDPFEGPIIGALEVEVAAAAADPPPGLGPIVGLTLANQAGNLTASMR